MLAPVVLGGDAVVSWGGVADQMPFGASAGHGDPLGATGALPESPQLGPDALAPPDDSGQTGIGDSPGIPRAALAAYRKAERIVATTTPGCHLDWALLAGIGRIESGHARGGAVDARGTTLAPILGPELNGAPGVAAVPDTDGGQWDSDAVWDRAVGPMQFIPSTWRIYQASSNAKGFGQADPNNIYDAALAAGNYLCSAGGDLRDRRQRAAAVFNYNHSDSYVRTVLLWADAYAKGISELPDASGAAPALPLAQPQPPLVGPPSTVATTPPAEPVLSTTTTVTSTPTSTTTRTVTVTATATTVVTTTTTTPPGCPTTTTTTTTTTTSPTATTTPTTTTTTTSTPTTTTTTPPNGCPPPGPMTSPMATTTGPVTTTGKDAAARR